MHYAIAALLLSACLASAQAGRAERDAPAAPAAARAQLPAAPAAPATPAAEPLREIRHVVVVSVDGLRPDAIDGPEDGPLPAFRRLQRGPHTLQARADPDQTITLPNHISMVTSRQVEGPQGHGWRANTDPRSAADGGTLHAHKGSYIASMFDVAHDRGLLTGVVATKTKFVLFSQSYDEEQGAPDAAAPDHGRAKLDIFTYARTAPIAAQAAAGLLRAAPGRSLLLLHLSDGDLAGHAYGWDMNHGTRYRAAVSDADAALGILLAAIDGDDRLRGHVAIVVTADHGGGVPFRTHTETHAPENFLVPFLVWLGTDTESQELAALNADRRMIAPASQWLPREASPAPIRSAEAGNLALQLLGLPAIPGSTANALQDLRLTPAVPQ